HRWPAAARRALLPAHADGAVLGPRTPRPSHPRLAGRGRAGHAGPGRKALRRRPAPPVRHPGLRRGRRPPRPPEGPGRQRPDPRRLRRLPARLHGDGRHRGGAGRTPARRLPPDRLLRLDPGLPAGPRHHRLRRPATGTRRARRPGPMGGHGRPRRRRGARPLRRCRTARGHAGPRRRPPGTVRHPDGVLLRLAGVRPRPAPRDRRPLRALTREPQLPPATPTPPRNFGDVIADVARRWPHRQAIGVVGGPAVTYRTFDDRTTRLANALLSVASPGDRIAVWLPTGIEYLEVYGAAAKAGMVLVPVHERFTAEEAAYILDDSESRVLIHGAPMDERVAQLDTSTLGRVVTPAAYDEFLCAGTGTMPAGPAADDLFLVAYTSGTTGFPKGAMVTHRAVLRGMRVTAMASRLVAYGTQAYASSMSFVPTVTAQILPHLALAGRVLLCGGWDPGRVVDALDRHRATYVYVPTPGLADFAAAVTAAGPQRCPSLATVLHAGSKAPPAALAAAAGALGGRFVEGWGMTENSGFLLTATTTLDMTPPGPSAEVLASVGRPVPGAEIDVVGDDGASLPRDGTTVGGLWARSATLMQGYWRNDRATAAAL